MTRMLIRVEAFDLPGRHSGSHRDVHVGVQRRGDSADVLDPVPADVAAASWQFEATVSATDAGIDVRGPYLQGRPGDRFIYLSWAPSSMARSRCSVGPSCCCPASIQTRSARRSHRGCWWVALVWSMNGADFGGSSQTARHCLVSELRPGSLLVDSARWPRAAGPRCRGRDSPPATRVDVDVDVEADYDITQ